MSSILKALKRLEQQKAVRRDLDHDMAWIAGDAGARPEQMRRWPTVAALVAVAGVSMLFTYWFTGGGNGRPHPANDGEARRKTEVPPFQSPFPSTPVPQVKVEQPSAPPKPRPAAVSPAPGKPSSALPRAVSEMPAMDGDGDPSNAAAVSVREELRKAPRQTASQRPAESAVSRPSASSAMPRLNVTGIAWENDSPVHFAVVNGQSVTEGSTVEGARVEKIFPDRVSFSYQNRTLEVPLDE